MSHLSVNVDSGGQEEHTGKYHRRVRGVGRLMLSFVRETRLLRCEYAAGMATKCMYSCYIRSLFHSLTWHMFFLRRTVLVDVGKSFQAAAVEWFPKYGLRRIDAVLITHAHADGE